MAIKLLEHQAAVFNEYKDFENVGLFHDMGVGKTFTGSELANNYGLDIVVVCQHSLISTWLKHFQTHYPHYTVYNLCETKTLETFLNVSHLKVGVLNYDIIFRDRMKPLLGLTNYTLILDESSVIQNPKSKRGKAVLKLKPTHTLLLTGSLMNGKYERLWSQCRLLGWDISEKLFLEHYCITDYVRDRRGNPLSSKLGFPIKQVIGYKNVDRLKRKLREYGGSFLKTEEVLTLPEQTFTDISVATTKEYKRFQKTKVVDVEGETLVGDTTLTKLLYSRMLCGAYNPNKIQAFKDLLDSTNDRLIVFYNFNKELEKLLEAVGGRPVSTVNGAGKDLENFENCGNSVTFIQYQAGSFGLNLQKANKIVYFTPPLSSEHLEQSKKRTHRIGQTEPCFYYNLVCEGSVEEKIYEVLAMRRDFTNDLFEEFEKNLKNFQKTP